MTEDKKLSERVRYRLVLRSIVQNKEVVAWAEEIADLEQQNAGLQRRLDKWNRGHNSLHSRNADEKIADLEKRLAEAEKEAEHYKYVTTVVNGVIEACTKEKADLRAMLHHRRAEIERLDDYIRMIHATEDSYDDEQTVLSKIYAMCEEARKK